MMRKNVAPLAALALLAAAACTQQPSPLWFEGDSLEAALEQAAGAGKLVLVDFTSPT